MAEETIADRLDLLCERRLFRTDADLHRRFRDSVFSIDRLLANYKHIFPFYTDHTFEHSEQVIRYCNIIAGEKIIEALNPGEIYILLMGASLHDVGMGISESNFTEFAPLVPGLRSYMELHAGQTREEYTRVFHQEFSACFIRKYRALLDLPSEEYVHGIIQTAKGHRKADLLDLSEYPTDFPLPNGRTANLAYLAALVKLADELDITADRNLLFDYNTVDENWSEEQKMCYQCHGAIRRLEVREDELVLLYHTDSSAVAEEILHTRSKVERTFAEYCAVTAQRTPFSNRIKRVLFEATDR